MCQIDDGYADHLLSNLQQLNHASVISGMVRLPQAQYIHLESCLFDAGSITKKVDGGNYIDPDHVEDNMARNIYIG